MTKRKQIVLTGGGTAGHVMVNLAIIPILKQDGWKIDYIGSKKGIERDLIENLEGITYHPISTGKLRRYASIENFKDPFKVLNGIRQATMILHRLKPQVIFSKGGFVSVPVLMASRLKGVPAIIHESDITPGLANKLAMPFAKRILATFPETLDHLSKEKAKWIGAVIRPELFEGDQGAGLKMADLDRSKPVMMVMGGSAGSKRLNEAVREQLDTLLATYQVIHICGKDHLDSTIHRRGYKQFEYVNKGLPDLLAATDVVVSRAGANAIFEFLALKKPMLLIPLSRQASRGDQILNAKAFEKQGYAHVLYEEDLNDQSFIKKVNGLTKNKDQIKNAMNQYERQDATQRVIDELYQLAKSIK
ncbi:UDP-N-acetylglucosamine-N-acetylmuramylpentapeptide N-acetylglucosamine transferase [Pelagirhabdus alkalitolerans]|uniref:UDP-N-acetylglucosamine--N-acetylmuramyl-(pentapeptide) pyrophosphoryl-undecaprenol N-acetylglucosamine transferase n=1 Tax=Pelagirhabdus alkalitolerans TaxID=1612202 RepID=A0A1G6N864_9BACI|nr:undecaprenyldiphospho-muramoylpentapeptide beta-N-acetylglucosaminyltransferase [Pelagirhabdus alkalitolerans]SDC63881.1 UDP-N-acetylglucosamine-N-acetylmuramylpentapeptide N-acetylglucosamine transferase [Pelagirhabdus alkalitolerans]